MSHCYLFTFEFLFLFIKASKESKLIHLPNWFIYRTSPFHQQVQYKFHSLLKQLWCKEGDYTKSTELVHFLWFHYNMKALAMGTFQLCIQFDYLQNRRNVPQKIISSIRILRMCNSKLNQHSIAEVFIIIVVVNNRNPFQLLIESIEFIWPSVLLENTKELCVCIGKSFAVHSFYKQMHRKRSRIWKALWNKCLAANECRMDRTGPSSMLPLIYSKSVDYFHCTKCSQAFHLIGVKIALGKSNAAFVSIFKK